MENVKTVTKIEIDNKTLYVKIFWQPNENHLLHITIYDSDKTWSGEFSNADAEEFREILDKTEDEYYSILKKGITEDRDFTYSFDVTSDESAEFIITGVNSSMQVQFCSVLVQRGEVTESKDLLIDDLLTENEQLKTSLDKMNSKNKELSLDLDKCKAYLEEYREMKNSLESNLYGKFVQLLNTKKRRIQLLEENYNKLAKLNPAGDELN